MTPQRLDRLARRPVVPSPLDVECMSDEARYMAAVEAAQQISADALIARLCSTHSCAVLAAARALVEMPSYRMPRRREATA